MSIFDYFKKNDKQEEAPTILDNTHSEDLKMEDKGAEGEIMPEDNSNQLEFISAPPGYIPDLDANYSIIKSVIKNESIHVVRFSLVQANLIIKQLEFGLGDIDDDLLDGHIYDAETSAVGDLRYYWASLKERYTK